VEGPYGGGPPPPAPGAGGVGIKRRAGRASGSADPMVTEESSYYGGPPPPPPGASALAAQLLTNILQQTARDQEAARYAVNEAHLAKALYAHSVEAQRMKIPEAIRPVHNNTIKTILKKDHVRQPITPAAPTAAEQIANVDLSNAEGAAIAHARGGGNASTLMEKLIDTAARPLEPVRSAASKVLKTFTKKAFMATAGAAASALKASTKKGVEVAAPVPAVVRAKAAPAQPAATPAPPSSVQPQPAQPPVTRPRANAKAAPKPRPPPAPAPPSPIVIPAPAAVTTLAVNRVARRKREEVQLRKEDERGKRPRPAPVMGGSRKRKGGDEDGKAIRLAPEPRIRQVPPQAPAAAIEDTRRKKDQEDTPAVRTSANARGAGANKKSKKKGGNARAFTMTPARE